jgi:hypothetical protein
VGKFLHAATLAWANTGDAQLKEKIDRVAGELVKCQKEDGYLGTYEDKERWTSWDVWSHKYNLIGLLTYYQYTGNSAALEACKKMGDLLCNTFGPGKRDIIAAGTHMGMAATSVLEPMVLLYRFSGDERHLEFAKYLVRSWDQKNGPGIAETLTRDKRVNKTANGKAYEMMSNLVGLCELYRVTGDKRLLAPALNAWEDIVANHLYITGSASQGEHFHEPHQLPNASGAHVAETCVTVTWIQLTAELLRITGEARFGDQLERTFFNHLAAAQRPDGAQWCYFTALQGSKPYGGSTNCCLSSGPRGMAMAPQLSYYKCQIEGKDALVANIYEPAEITAQLGGREVGISAKLRGQEMPNGAIGGRVVYTLAMEQPATFAFKVRAPAWATNLKLAVENETNAQTPREGWATLSAREWKNGDRIVVSMEVFPRVIAGEYSNKGYYAVTWGPLVLAYDEQKNPGLPLASSVALLEDPALKLVPGEMMMFAARIRGSSNPEAKVATFIPFSEAGADGGRYQVWVRDPGNLAPMSLLSDGQESRSRRGNLGGSIIDADTETHVVTFDGKAAEEDWYAVTLGAAVSVKRIVVAHGHCFHDGGWFDASGGKPRVQVQVEKNGAWQTVGVLEGYPATTAKDARGLQDGQAFTLVLKEAMKVVGVRVVGKPACGDDPAQAFSSCGEVQAFGE